jgi:hypothetical protein
MFLTTNHVILQIATQVAAQALKVTSPAAAITE